jgi:hypothetical protein
MLFDLFYVPREQNSYQNRLCLSQSIEYFTVDGIMIHKEISCHQGLGQLLWSPDLTYVASTKQQWAQLLASGLEH